MKFDKKYAAWAGIPVLAICMTACKKDHMPVDNPVTKTISIENVLDSRSLVESGAFQGTGTPPVINPGESVSFSFSASPGQTVTFASMYGWSNDLFFAPANPGIALYDKDKKPIEGDVSDQIKLWDNGSRVNQAPGSGVMHPGTAETGTIKEINGTDAQGNTYPAASKLVNLTLKYNGDSYFTLTIKNISGSTNNTTPLSPGVWAVSYIVGGNLLNTAPLFAEGQSTTDGLTKVAEAGDNSGLWKYVMDNTGIFTPLSPVLVVVYNGIADPIFKEGELDRGDGLKDLAQRGDATALANYLATEKGVKKVYVLPAVETKVLLPRIGDQAGSKVSQELSVAKGDKVALATMYGFSNDWFFSTSDIDPMQATDISGTIRLYNDGTAIDQFPGAGNAQFNLGNATSAQSKAIQAVPNPNPFTTLPGITQIMKVTIQ